MAIHLTLPTQVQPSTRYSTQMVVPHNIRTFLLDSKRGCKDLGMFTIKEKNFRKLFNFLKTLSAEYEIIYENDKAISISNKEYALLFCFKQDMCECVMYQYMYKKSKVLEGYELLDSYTIDPRIKKFMLFNLDFMRKE